jgi:hypothetical protein
MRTKRTSNAERRTPNIERRHDGLNFIFDVGSSEFDVRCFRPSRPSQRGVALIITLILLSVVTFMAITFLALSRRERSAVSTVTDTASARLAADAALANAEGQIMANTLSTTNPYNFGLLVSTNYINPLGFNPTLGANLTNVNYYDVNGNFLPSNNIPNFLQLLANLYYSPRPPVFIPTNSAGANDFRFYLDLNRNGRDDPNGLLPVISPDPANPYYDLNGNTMPNIIPGNTLSNLMVGDPEWIGILQRPDQPYGPNNPFVARYAFIAVPVGNTLDLNAIHNNARRSDQVTADDGFFRNQGVGSWEINLAAFLADLNTNQWFQNPFTSISYYDYEPTYSGGPLARYTAFDDALSLLNYRYGGGYANLAWVQNLYPFSLSVFQNDIDAYSDWQPLMTTPAGINVSGQHLNVPWSGADNTNHFFTHQELFNPNESSIFFTNRLQSAGTNVSTYDRYTFYRLLSQLGTDSTPESGKMNLNYDNLDPFVTNAPASTNFMAWQPLAFFTNAADRLLRAYTTQWRNSNPTNFATTFYAVPSYTFTNINFTADQWTNYPAFGIGKIPVLVSNQFVYSPAVNRLLQLAANMYDATTNSYYPSVFRPCFSRDFYGNLFITGYTNVDSVSGVADSRLFQPFDASQVLLPTGSNVFVNVYGVPWIIGAKKGFPNFNEFSMENIVGVTRRLQFTRTTNSSTPVITGTNEMYMMNLNSSIGVELWNSYTNNYPGTILIGLNENASVAITNDDRNVQNPLFLKIFTTNIVISISSWSSAAQWTAGNPNSASFVFTNFTGPTLTNSVYRSSYAGAACLPPGFVTPCFVPTNYFNNTSPLLFETNSPNGFYLPQFGVVLTNRLQVFMLDGNHVIDYVQFAGPNSGFNLNSAIADLDNNNTVFSQNTVGVWNTNYPPGQSPPYGVTWGIIKQILISEAGQPPSEDGTLAGDAQAFQLGGTPPQQQASFAAFFKPRGSIDTAPGWGIYSQATASNVLLSVQAPYTPTRYAVQYLTWQANDPLVHYLASDIASPLANPVKKPKPGLSQANTGDTINGLTNLNLGKKNDGYRPWGSNPGSVDPNFYNPAERDPLVYSSDNWDFPTNKFPTVGWLGRVHRGTPWQTVYLKASDILGETNASGNNIGTTNWMTWTGNLNTNDAVNAAPVQDRLLFDLFTTAFNDNATRGTLSVNVGPTNANLAAWSALFSGIAVPTRLTNTYTIIAPAGPAGAPVPVGPPLSPNSPLCLGYLVQNGTNGINDIRANTNLFPLQSFTHVGDILAVPALTERSPFLVGLDPNTQINDEMYEWLPQQTMSLLRLGGSGSPRYVIYSYGQALKPAPNGIYTGSDHFGMVTNYQVVSEIATRAVVRFNSTLTNIITTNTFYALEGSSSNYVQMIGWTSFPVVTNNNAVIESFNILPPD